MILFFVDFFARLAFVKKPKRITIENQCYVVSRSKPDIQIKINRAACLLYILANKILGTVVINFPPQQYLSAPVFSRCSFPQKIFLPVKGPVGKRHQAGISGRKRRKNLDLLRINFKVLWMRKI